MVAFGIYTMKWIEIFCFVLLFYFSLGTEEKNELDAKYFIHQFNMISTGAQDSPHMSPLLQFGGLTNKLPDTYPENATRYAGSWSYALFQDNDTEPFAYFPGRCVITLLRGRPLEIYVINPLTENLTTATIGPRMRDGFSAIIPKGSYLGLRLKRRKLPGGFALLGYSAFPELNSNDIAPLNPKELRKRFPQHKRAIKRVSKPTS